MMVMRFHASHVSTSVSGDYYQVMFEAEQDSSKLNSPYVIIQRQFEFEDEGRCSIETHEPKYCGHPLSYNVEFTDSRFAIEFDNSSDSSVRIEVSFESMTSDLAEFTRVVNTITDIEDPL